MTNPVIDFLTGEMLYEEFMERWNRDDSLLEWIDSNTDMSFLKPEWENLPYAYVRAVIKKHFGGSFRAWEEYDRNGKKHWTPACLERRAKFNAIAGAVLTIYPELKLTGKYEDEANFYHSAVSDHFGGREVEAKIEADVMRAYNEKGSKAGKRKLAKQMLNELFHIEDKKYPHWVQEPEWPMGEKSPMKFIGQERTGERVRFTFRDADTDEERVIEQLY